MAEKQREVVPVEPSCGKCKYYDVLYTHTCRRFPPSPIWPTVNEGDWCGEFVEGKTQVSPP